MKSLIKKYRFLGKPLFLILSFSFFYSSFQKNILEFASPRMVEVFAMGTESFIINRIVPIPKAYAPPINHLIKDALMVRLTNASYLSFSFS